MPSKMPNQMSFYSGGDKTTLRGQDSTKLKGFSASLGNRIMITKLLQEGKLGLLLLGAMLK